MKLKELIKNVENVELTPEQEKQIKEYLGIKEAPKRFIPKDGDKYYFILGDGDISDQIYDSKWAVDRDHLAMSNCFKTEDDAEFAVQKHLVYQELKNFADENNGRPIEWQQPNIENYYIYLAHDDNILHVSDCYICQDLGQIYFSSKELAEQAIETVGADRIKKYLFGVE